MLSWRFTIEPQRRAVCCLIYKRNNPNVNCLSNGCQNFIIILFVKTFSTFSFLRSWVSGIYFVFTRIPMMKIIHKSVQMFYNFFYRKWRILKIQYTINVAVQFYFFVCKRLCLKKKFAIMKTFTNFIFFFKEFKWILFATLIFFIRGRSNLNDDIRLITVARVILKSLTSNFGIKKYKFPVS